jgi:hypothetical protein
VDCHRPLPTQAAASVSFLWSGGRLILSVNIRVDHAGCGARMVWRGAPSILPELDSAELLQDCAPPVCGRSRCFQAALTLSAVLVTQHPQFSGSIPTQSMGTKQPWQPFVNSFDRTFVGYRRPDQLINIVNRLNIGSDDTHLSSKLTD